jgi:hypothetical protein
MALIYDDPTNEPYNVNHGDLWVNNLVFHYPPESSGKEPDEMRLLDFQQTRYTFPAMDVSHISSLTFEATYFRTILHNYK